MSNFAFIIGCARSGTSILGELIARHPRVSYIYEEAVWRKMENEFETHSLDPRKITKQKKKKIRAWLETYRKDRKWVIEKNPRHMVRIPFIKALFPSAKIIHIVRDGRDVSCSLKTGLCGKTWAHVKPPNWKTIEAKYEGVVRCAHAWRDVMTIAARDLKTVDHLQIKYEDLIRDPIRTANKVLMYLGLSMCSQVFDFCNKIQNGTKGSYVAQNQMRWYKEDHTKRVGRWKENMTPQEQADVEKILRPVLNYYGYK